MTRAEIMEAIENLEHEFWTVRSEMIESFENENLEVEDLRDYLVVFDDDTESEIVVYIGYAGTSTLYIEKVVA